MTQTSGGPGAHALITGGGTGLGRGAAEALSPTHSVSLLGRREGPLKEAADGFPNAAFFQADVTDREGLFASVNAAIARFGRPTALVAAAGISETAPLDRTSPEMLRRLLAVNVEGVLNAIQAVLPAMIEARRGRIVVVASTAAIKGYAYAGAYAASKHAVLGLVRSLAVETARTGVTVNAVCPGFADTEMTAASIERIVERTGRSAEEARRALEATNPMQRLVTPQEVGDTVRWLCGAGAAAITGQAIAVAGGEVM